MIAYLLFSISVAIERAWGFKSSAHTVLLKLH